MTDNKAYLLLADGSVYQGFSLGAKGQVIGEIVFATGMTGYQETLTDPSYFGQIVTQTFPLIGNYGLNDSDFESDKCYLSGYIVREWCEEPSNFRCKYNLDEFLKAQNVIGLYGIDTRSLTKKIREYGVMNGAITTDISNKEELLKQIKDFKITKAVKSVTCKESTLFKVEQPKFKVGLFDFGYKHNILRELLSRDCEVTVLPANTTAKEIESLKLDGIMLSNGPGDPAENTKIIKNLQEINKLKIPTFGICLGHQLMALANGAKTQKLKYGHRGANQPVLDIQRDRTYITSQNHGYAVMGETIDPTVGEVSHINSNDHTCEGVRYKNIPAFTVQFHPEACGGPQDTAYLFGEFIDLMGGNK